MPALVIAEHDNSYLKISTLNTVTAATLCSNEIHILIIGYNIEKVILDAKKVNNIKKILLVDSLCFSNKLPENIATQISVIASNYSHILAPATIYGKNILPRVAALLDVMQISEITKVCNSNTFERPIYAGSIIATVQSTDIIKVITVRTTSFVAAKKEGNKAIIEIISKINYFSNTASIFISRELIKSKRPELTSAKIVIAGGRGLGSSKNFKILEELADKLNAAIGASRAAVDAGYISNNFQVGQTGKIVAPQLYIAIGISGAIQHLSGMKDSKIIVAINQDKDAPIFDISDYGLVGDLFEIIPKFIKYLT
ncbi:electron transfer flavoprotein subunit alpha [Candidatus Profftella armatura (Diaphorina cf. continua)]|uniref:Electron transfer flavoprotein subunit alpha n=1 Tax=Candidatus Profftella armatura (Diaphorina cf. continua) TaxID=2661583 RepID=A0A7R6VYU2_9PROT|nr:FAD-binding protein [Candidatus Profftella armatura (Diaphorina cf. continua)]BCG49697.1 electron transfer flavoprotein subunit alpha [Candidatus Profftella armatura (Diaphorina cf. continua)]